MSYAQLGDELTDRELQVLRGAAYGESQSETAARLRISSATIHSHRRQILTKLGARNMTNAVAVAYEMALLCAERYPEGRVA